MPSSFTKLSELAVRALLNPILAHNFQNAIVYSYFSDISQLTIVFRLFLRYNLNDASILSKGVPDDENISQASFGALLLPALLSFVHV